MNDLFKKNVGEFILLFSEIEFSITVLISFIEKSDIKKAPSPEILGLNLSRKKEKLRNLLKGNENLLNQFCKIETKLSVCNEFRRHIAHGVVSNHPIGKGLESLINAKRNGINGYLYKELTSEEVYEKNKILYDINAGIHGLGDLGIKIKEWIKN